MSRQFSYPPPIMDKATLAWHLSIHPDTVDARIEAGLLPPGTMWGGKLMWKWADVEAQVSARLGPSNDLAAKVRHATRKIANVVR